MPKPYIIAKKKIKIFPISFYFRLGLEVPSLLPHLDSDRRRDWEGSPKVTLNTGNSTLLNVQCMLYIVQI